MKRILQFIVGLLFVLFAIIMIFFVPFLADVFQLNNLRQWLIVGVFFVCFEILLTVFVSFVFILPIEKLLSYLKHTTIKGDLPERLPFHTPEELQRVYTAFRENIAGLYKRIKRLESLSGSDEVRYLLITTVTHRLRTPLTGLRWAMNELIEHGTFANEKDRRLIAGAATSTKRINEIVETLLKTSEVQSRHGVYIKEQIDMEIVLDNVIKETALLAGSKQCTVTLEDNEHKIPTIEGDVQQISLALQNVVSNAIYYSHDGQHIVITARHKGNMLEIHIIDHGIGIQEEEKAILFELFQRGRQSFTMNTEGTGLGLYLTKQIIANHNGEVALIDTPGGGTTVIITLPIRGTGELETFVER